MIDDAGKQKRTCHYFCRTAGMDYSQCKRKVCLKINRTGDKNIDIIA